MSGEATIRVSEIFGPTIQGEGALIGVPTVFVRTGGCDYRCEWCDSLHAVEAEYRGTWTPMTAQEIMAEVVRLSGGKPLLVSLSGGNPAIQPLGEVIRQGHAQGYGFALETQGSVARDWFSDLDMLVLSPKPPSSGMQVDWPVFDACLQAGQGADMVMKIVIFDDTDYAWARDVAARYPQLPLFLQPGNHTPPPPDDDSATVDQDGVDERMRWLVDRVVQDRWYQARVLPQLHVMLWGNKRGV
ncbi:preQ(0) biosynthesis protein QueE [Roseovarius pacificus]|uniref:7-carboxy-7-deazaguanine synthase n=1 Tax=Roseovarius pacificus TaxID=337701 RepID=A0A1M7DFR8_9RHOB|nr:7-carboxy-7-deazaguanine synthase QueE [Roseovarius pacificus]GGO56852.1 7-carboxy-7-deazaguanine synthase [Roseovarius pacificus]SHL78258.1 preQ(0) biosynthesis protein QueE [Roseovarius pacificus]